MQGLLGTAVRLRGHVVAMFILTSTILTGILRILLSLLDLFYSSTPCSEIQSRLPSKIRFQIDTFQYPLLIQISDDVSCFFCIIESHSNQARPTYCKRTYCKYSNTYTFPGWAQQDPVPTAPRHPGTGYNPGPLGHVLRRPPI